MHYQTLPSKLLYFHDIFDKVAVTTLKNNKRFPDGSKMYLAKDSDQYLVVWNYTEYTPTKAILFRKSEDEVLCFDSLNLPARPGEDQDRKQLFEKINYFLIHARNEECVTMQAAT